MVYLRVFFEIPPRHAHEFMGGLQTRAGGGPLGIFMHSQVHKTAGELDEGLIKIGIRLPARFQPKILENIVGFVEFACIKALKITEIPRIATLAGQMRHPICDASTLMRHAPSIL